VSAVAAEGSKLSGGWQNLQDVAAREPQLHLAPDLLFFFLITPKPRFE